MRGSRAAKHSNRWRRAAAGLTAATWLACMFAATAASPASARPASTTARTAAATDPAPGSISGTVLDDTTHQPLSGVCATAYPYGTALRLVTSCSAADGSYHLQGLVPSDYSLNFYDPTASHVGGHPSRVPVASGQAVTGIDAAMTATGSVGGVVTDATTGAPLANVCVAVSQIVVIGPVLNGCSDATGHYLTTGLYPGASQLLAHDRGGHHRDLLVVSGPTVQSGATAIYNVALQAGGAVSGRAVDAATNAPIAGMCVGVSGTGAVIPIADHCSGTDGRFTRSGLGAGNATVSYTDSTGRYLVPAPTSAYVPDGQITDLGDVRFTLGATLSGTVRDSSGTPVAGVCVAATLPGVLPPPQACADAHGVYTIKAVPAGTITLSASDGAQRYIGTGVPGPFTVTAGQTLSGIDVGVTLGGSITGTISDATTGNPVMDLCPVLHRSDGTQVGASLCSDPAGRYTIAALPTGTYTVEFPSDVTQWFNGQGSQATATPISVTVGSETGGIDAHLARGASVTGTIRDAQSGQPIAGACVTLEPPSGSPYSIRSACSGANGVYSFQGVGPTTYLVSVGSVGNYPGAQFPSLTLTSGQAVTGHDLQLTQGGRIVLTVLDATSNTPVPGTCAIAFGPDGGLEFNSHACVDSTGALTMQGLVAGNSKVQIYAPTGWVSDWYDGQSSQATATQIPVVAGQTLHLTTHVAHAGAATGRVVDRLTGLPIAGVCAVFVNATATYNGACSDNDGVYTVTGIPAGSYQVHFSPESMTPTYAAEWLGGGATQASSKTVTITVGQTTAGVNAALADLGHPNASAISGTIRDLFDGSAQSSKCAFLFSTSGTYLNQYGCSRADGTYVIPNVGAGSYKILLGDFTGADVTSWIGAKPDLASADVITVAAGADLQGVDGWMVPARSVSGVVRDAATGNPLANIAVYLYNADGTYAHVAVATDATGTYVLRNVPVGTYKLAFLDWSGAHTWTWYANKPDVAMANTIRVLDGHAVGGANASLAPYTAKSLSGTVREASTNTPLQNITVFVYDPAGNWTGRSATTAADGTWSIGNLVPGQYKVVFVDWTGSHAVSWANGKPDQSSADWLTVPPSGPGPILTTSLPRTP